MPARNLRRQEEFQPWHVFFVISWSKTGSGGGASRARDKIGDSGVAAISFQCLHGDPLPSKAMKLEEAILRFGREKRNGPASRARGRVVFTNGGLDLRHPGHVRGLEQARQLGAVRIAGLNSGVRV